MCPRPIHPAVRQYQKSGCHLPDLGSGKKIPLDIQPSSFIPRPIIERGVRILAITLAFQAREAGSIPARRSNFPHL